MSDDEQEAPLIDSTGGVEGVRQSLLKTLQSLGESMTVNELLSIFDQDGGALIEFHEFERTMRSERFGYEGDSETLRTVFDGCDNDKSGRIGFDELYRFIRGVPRSNDRSKKALQLVSQLTLQPKPGQPGCELNFGPDGWLLDYDKGHTWTGDDLRLELQVLLVGNEISPADWFRSWDTDRSSTLSKIEFLTNLRKLFQFTGGPDLWENRVKKPAEQIFITLAGSDKLLDITEFETWLAESWVGRSKHRRGGSIVY